MVPSDRDPISSLDTIRKIGASIGSKVVNPKRTSYGALEVDVFSQTKGDFETFVAALEPLGVIEFAKDLQTQPPHLEKADAIAEAVALFDAERFWEAHEVLESLWRVAQGDEKKLLQGLILVCAAFVHLQKDEGSVALGILRRAEGQLDWPGGTYHTIDVAALRKKVGSFLRSGRVNVFRI